MYKVFRHYLPFSLSLLAVAETLIFFSILRVLYATQPGWLMLSGGPATPDLFASVMMTAICFLSFSALGIYNRDAFFSVDRFLPRAGIAAFFTVIGIFLAMQVYGLANVSYPRWYFALAVVAVLLYGSAITLMRYGVSLVSGIELFKRRVLLVGDGEQVERLKGLIATDRHRQLVLAGVLGRDAPEFAQCASNAHPPALFPDESVEKLLKTVRAQRVDEIVLASDQLRGFPFWDILRCRMDGFTITDYLTFLERETGRIDLEQVRPAWMALADGFANDATRKLLKRGFDVSVSLAILLATLPITLPVALLIKLESRGPVFYRQSRVGLHGQPFDILKFRSMTVDAEGGKPTWATKDDLRVTRIGKLIRKPRIDEIPQVINVLRGEMSFVGPRPERPFFVEELAQEIPLYGARHNVKPGITGWAQINYPYGASVEDARQKLSYDLYYVKNNSLFLDLIILLQTVRVVIMLIGSR